LESIGECTVLCSDTVIKNEMHGEYMAGCPDFGQISRLGRHVIERRLPVMMARVDRGRSCVSKASDVFIDYNMILFVCSLSWMYVEAPMLGTGQVSASRLLMCQPQ